jgi:hypothetical protein
MIKTLAGVFSGELFILAQEGRQFGSSSSMRPGPSFDKLKTNMAPRRG